MTTKLKLTIPEHEIESGAWYQIRDALKIPSLKKLAIMPDVHQGYDLPIGGVALLDDHIWPGAVGYDIGCGMCHSNTGMPVEYISERLKDIYDEAMERIPVGFNTHAKENPYPIPYPNSLDRNPFAENVNERANIQHGTLGGGNHFIEVGVNNDGEVGITIHSGSRKAGHYIGGMYMKLSNGPVHIDSTLGKAYLTDMNWALDYALSNRMHMMRVMCDILGVVLNEKEVVNENHNHAVVTEDGVLHRKGATPAEKGQIGIIPANMRDGVLITCGLGNEDYLCSASHGAGRVLSRNKAKKSLSFEEFEEDMKGIVAPVTTSNLDEAPSAYKDIDFVIDAQEDLLINVVDHFKPLIVIKG